VRFAFILEPANTANVYKVYLNFFSVEHSTDLDHLEAYASPDGVRNAAKAPLTLFRAEVQGARTGLRQAIGSS
jgi:hypothetical protein